MVLISLIGLAVGSFLNVCISRIPEEESVVKPRSRCPRCHNLIEWYDNIPVISYIILRARCRHCREKISVQYPLVEIGFVAMLLHLYHVFAQQGLSGHILFLAVGYYGILCACLLVATVIDLFHYIIPDEINIVGILIALAGAVAFPVLVGGSTIFDGFIHSAVGISAGFVLLRMVVWIGALIFRKDAMGLGDPKFLAMIGAFLGWKQVLLVIFLSSSLGALIGGLFVILFRKNKKDTVIPYGPFLALGAYISMLYGDDLIKWYFSLVQPNMQ
jgi:leader peptidase (prepilin peptidase)/N-methyltransferase